MSAPKFEFLCILPDKEGVREKRLEIRPLHFAGLQKLVEEGFLTWGGAMLNTVPTDDTLDFKGSALTAYASSKEELMEKLNSDPYAVHGVWDMEKAQIIPFKCALREPLQK
ncbi:YCII-related domain protein [Ascodesmis nigricans]|uniref:YCII-related domain protein n=1 Tax=Ascodesmis nigricans TaxID=341454 RepID=A0A4S2N248_9PEZI|nr:YCII-related domain protein [Ascodesmis nigricans]